MDLSKFVQPRSQISGRLPRNVAVRQREANDVDYRRRMEAARRELAAEFSSVVPESLAQMRLRRGLSQQRLAEMIGTSQSHVAKIEAGTINLYWHTVVRLADALSVSLDELRPLISINEQLPKVQGERT